MKITDVKVVFICPDHNEKYKARKIYTESLLKKIGFKDIVHYKSGTKNYPIPLLEAQINILKTYLDEPVLIVEDDIGFTGVNEFEFVIDADAIYFGLSRSGGHPLESKDEGSCVLIPYSKSYVRVLNMLATHAILFISRSYKEAIIHSLSKHLESPYHSDVLMSRIQKDYLVLAQKKPSFFQAALFNNTQHEQNWTDIIINDDLSISPGKGHHYDLLQCYIPL